MSDNNRLPIRNKQKEKEKSSNSDKAKGAATMAAGGYVAKKTLTNLVPGALGFQTEEHVTSKNNAKKILKDGYLRASKGGSEEGLLAMYRGEKDANVGKGKVFMTGATDKKGIGERVSSALGKRVQKLIHSSMHSAGDLETPKDGLKKILKGKGTSKTLYTSHPESYFSKNFSASTEKDALNDLMTTKDVKVRGNRLAALYDGLKEHGLKGMTENKGRTAAYLAATGGLGYGAAKLIQNGYNRATGNNSK